LKRVRAKGPKKRITEKPHRINEKIRVDEIRLLVEGAESKVMKTTQALSIAQYQDLDLIEISPKSNPPVCKIADYNKFLYEQKKRDKEQKKKQVTILTKEVRFGPTTDAHDIEFKTNNARKFLQEGNKVRAFVFFKGRAIVHKDLGEKLLLKFAQSLQEDAKLDQFPKMEGKKMIIMLSPTKKKKQ
jgi:translation initiation factor IF-3